jgi:hypothetical protein
MDYIKNSLIIIILILIFLVFLASLLIGCATCKNDIQLPDGVKLPEGYSLIRDNEQIRVRCPDGYITGCQWETVEVAVEYCNSYNEWNKSH